MLAYLNLKILSQKSMLLILKCGGVRRVPRLAAAAARRSAWLAGSDVKCSAELNKYTYLLIILVIILNKNVPESNSDLIP